ncbi:hypothetical protein L0657_17610 [Dyadobacter sp. CY345]|uniref:DUF5672 family protein n=1 Tax=Dyadobacter sp. CY345 TaxID=2909335 RepID=UPI001F1E4F7C|nr:DUF5672 family protein [Dyadobacter sp. CY345]MCF2445782.1 hypothetical protein [Dyadobacter sp. CY345]
MKIVKQEPSAAIVIPVYKSELTYSEKLSLWQCMKVLSKFPVIIVKPESLDLPEIKQEYPAIRFKSFDDLYFKGIDAYNELMISANFYKTFADFDYILIYQLDAYVFKDELIDWCRKGYDYIGAPSLHREEFDTLSSGEKDTFANALSNNRFVLNGGLSLRKISSFLRYLKIYNTFYPAWLGNEDMLFSQEATRLIPMKLFLKLPTWQEALHFSFEKSPAATYEITNHQLPFACHAWERYDPEFWASFIPEK